MTNDWVREEARKWVAEYFDEPLDADFEVAESCLWAGYQRGREDIERLRPILADMRTASVAVDEAHGTSDYNARLVALALIARHFLRERGEEPQS